MEQKQVVIKNVLINYYVDENQGADTNLLFLHGWRSEGKIWNTIVESIKTTLPNFALNFYLIDLPGFGKSQVPDHALTLENYASFVEEFIYKLKLKNIILIGHSHGGETSINIASTNPEWLKKLVIVDSSGIRSDNKDIKTKNLVAKVVKPLFKPKFMQPLRKRIYKSMGAEDYLETPYLRDTFLNLIKYEVYNDLPKIKVPTLLIWGEDDMDTPVENGKLMHDNIKDSRFIVLQNAGHFSFLDQKLEFVEALLAFIQE